MKLALSEIIGKTITNIKYKYIPSNQHQLQEFHTYIQLSKSHFIPIPQYYNMNGISTLSHTNIKNTEQLSTKHNSLLLNQEIDDIYFCYYNNEIDEDKSAYIKLSNDIYITETQYQPLGVTNIGLLILNKKEFFSRTKRLRAC